MTFRPDTERLAETAQGLIEEHHLPGLALGAVIGGEPAWQDAWGWADIAAREPLTPEHRQRIASITKTTLGLNIMALIDEGRLALDSRISELLPDFTFRGPADDLAVRHLLTHTGGIGEAPNRDDLGQAFDKLFGESDPDTPLAELYANGITIEVEPGTKWAYANHGFALLGEIISRLEGVPLAESLRRRVFEPFGMRDTDLNDVPHPRLSRGYSQADTPEARRFLDLLGIQLESAEPEDDHNLPGKYVRVWGNGGAGGVQSTVPDMLTYGSALLRGANGIVRPETFAQMTSPHWQPDPRLNGWGLAFALAESFGHRWFGHGGAAFGGWNSTLAIFPDLNAALVIHVNLWRNDYDSAIVPPLLQTFLGAPDSEPPGTPLDRRIIDSAPGVYELASNTPLTDFRTRFVPGRVLISADDGGLTIRGQRGPWDEGVPLVAADAAEPDLLLAKKGAATERIVALFDGDEVSGLRFQTLFDLRRNPEAEPWT
ncbi:MAG TPA: serine hydrolase domain-containing protein [Dehalococcoidia bacterium]